MSQFNMNQCIMPQFIIVHCKHEGCYNPLFFKDENPKIRVASVQINPPKVFLFDNKPEAKEFFRDYINDVDVLDERCKIDEDINHVDYCNCGIVKLDDEDGQPILFYNQKNQIFLLEPTSFLFAPAHDLKMEMENLNLINSLVRKSKTLGKEQQRKYVDLGKRCEECLTPKTTTKTTTSKKATK